MEIDFSHLNLDDLDEMHQQAEAQLRMALLNGEPWEKIRGKREVVTRLAIAVHKRKYPLLSTHSHNNLQNSSARRNNPDF